MKLKIIVTILIVGLIGLIVGGYLFNKKVPTLNDVEAEYKVTADELYNAFETDESVAMKLYESKVISVEGEVADVKVKDNKTNIVLKAENAMLGGINCSFNHANVKVSKGDQVIIKGRCQGFLMDVILNNCEIDE